MGDFEDTYRYSRFGSPAIARVKGANKRVIASEKWSEMAVFGNIYLCGIVRKLERQNQVYRASLISTPQSAQVRGKAVAILPFELNDPLDSDTWAT